VVQKDIKMVSYSIVKADKRRRLGRGARQENGAAGNLRACADEMKKTAEDYLGEPVTER